MSTQIEVSKTSAHWSWTIAVIFVLPLLGAIAALGWRLSEAPQERYVTCVILIASVAVGWVVGMVLSPDSRTELNNFSALGKSISVFLTGYLAAKVDGVITGIFDPAVLLHATDRLPAYRMLGAIAAFILSALLVYVVRVYAFTVGSEEGARTRIEKKKPVPPEPVSSGGL